MRGQEELPGHLGPHPGPIRGRPGSAGGKAGRRMDRREASCHLEPERADITIDDLERDPQTGYFLEVADSQVRVLPAAAVAVRPTDADRSRTALASARRSPGRRRSGRRSRPGRSRSTPRAFRRVRCNKTPARCDLSRSRPRLRPAGSRAIPRPRCELVHAHRHTHPKGYTPPGRSGRPELLPTCIRCVTHQILKSSGGTVGPVG